MTTQPTPDYGAAYSIMDYLSISPEEQRHFVDGIVQIIADQCAPNPIITQLVTLASEYNEDALTPEQAIEQVHLLMTDPAQAHVAEMESKLRVLLAECDSIYYALQECRETPMEPLKVAESTRTLLAALDAERQAQKSKSE